MYPGAMSGTVQTFPYQSATDIELLNSTSLLARRWNELLQSFAERHTFLLYTATTQDEWHRRLMLMRQEEHQLAWSLGLHHKNYHQFPAIEQQARTPEVPQVTQPTPRQRYARVIPANRSTQRNGATHLRVPIAHRDNSELKVEANDAAQRDFLATVPEDVPQPESPDDSDSDVFVYKVAETEKLLDELEGVNAEGSPNGWVNVEVSEE
ncbi:hypothetical protein BDN72DRAFT_875936 [Pluteus cervinus]|uniref:Uncharacterized protein n=1 Tax=Pluteus cervinus TaxID=181527 RepID=A0ACD3B576_9AGAR|nr:hypothetical protein BDN72DRAFT_875936 [Pluteus cervinus]